MVARLVRPLRGERGYSLVWTAGVIALIAVPLPGWERMMKTSAFFSMFGMPIPAPNPSSRTRSGAGQYPGRLTRSKLSMPGPLSAKTNLAGGYWGW